MDDLISRQAAIDEFYEMASDIDHLCTVGDYISFLESLSAQPEIIYCGECKYMMPNGRCSAFAGPSIRPSASDYCSCAERRQDEQS